MEIEKITLELEDLTPPPNLLKITTPESIESRFSGACCSSLKNDLVLNSHHPVLDGFVRAFIEHRPVTISPDIIWLKIVQGFSYHVEYNAPSAVFTWQHLLQVEVTQRTSKVHITFTHF